MSTKHHQFVSTHKEIAICISAVSCQKEVNNLATMRSAYQGKYQGCKNQVGISPSQTSLLASECAFFLRNLSHSSSVSILQFYKIPSAICKQRSIKQVGVNVLREGQKKPGVASVLLESWIIPPPFLLLLLLQGHTRKAHDLGKNVDRADGGCPVASTEGWYAEQPYSQPASR